MSGQWKATSLNDHSPFKPVIKIGHTEMSSEMLDEMIDAMGFIKFLRTHDRNWEALYTTYRVTKRLEQK